MDEIIKSRLLLQLPNLIHGISTKMGGNNNPPFYNNLSYYVGDDKEKVKKNRDTFFSSLGIDQQKLAIPQQIHSDNVKIIDRPGYYPETDALITQNKDIFLIISTADCFSILIYDPVTEIIAAVHSGWRGTQKKILTKTLQIMLSELSCSLDNLKLFIGPGICKDHYEVGNDVTQLFEKRFIIEKNGRLYADLKAHIIDQISKIRLNSANTDTYPKCSFEERDYLHSYRRDKEKSGRMFSVIGMKG